MLAVDDETSMDEMPSAETHDSVVVFGGPLEPGKAVASEILGAGDTPQVRV